MALNMGKREDKVDENFKLVSSALNNAKSPYERLLPTMPWHMRTCPEIGCIEWAFVLSKHDKPCGTNNGFPIYNRTIKWKCERGHRSDTTRRVDMEGKTI